MTIAFQFAFESHLQDSVVAMARQYMRSIIASVQRIALALSSSRLVPQAGGISHAPAAAAAATPEAATLSRWICQSYRSVVCAHKCVDLNTRICSDAACSCRFHFGAELIKSADASGCEAGLKALWHHASAILCCSLKVCSVAI
jgi:homeobox-leucine zipper protein